MTSLVFMLEYLLGGLLFEVVGGGPELEWGPETCEDVVARVGTEQPTD